MINGSVLRDAIISGANNISKNKTSVDELNIFPVPDGDTGTNMSMTIQAAARELEKTEEESAGKVAQTAASALLRGAREKRRRNPPERLHKPPPRLFCAGPGEIPE